jgi:hypothetical protein
VITFSNHNSTIDDPFIIVGVDKALNYDTCRWEICGQDICYPSTAIGAGFMAGRVLPIQRGSGLWQPHFTRLHNLLSNGEWIHLFPEGKVQYTPDTFGTVRNSDDPPSALLPFKWGIGSLIAESLLRNEKPYLIPILHTSIRVHSKSAGIPEFGKEASILVGNDVISQVQPFVDEYVNHVVAYEENKISVEPQKEFLFIQITNKLKHVMDKLYYNVEKHSKIPLLSQLSHFQHEKDHMSNERLRNPCKNTTCWCQFSPSYPIHQRLLHHSKFSLYFQHKSSQFNYFQPHYNQFPHVVDNYGKLSTREQKESYQELLNNTKIDLSHKSLVKSVNSWLSSIYSPIPSFIDSSTIPLASTHDQPSLYRITTKKYLQQWYSNLFFADRYSNTIQTKYKPLNQWGDSQHNLPIDGKYPNVFFQNPTLQSHFDMNPYDRKHQDEFISTTYETLWKTLWTPARSLFTLYVPAVHGFIIDEQLFNKTWDAFMTLDYNNVTTSLKEQYKAKQMKLDSLSSSSSTLSTQPTNNGLNSDLTFKFNKDKEYLAQVILLRNRMNELKNTKGFDWNSA